MRIKLFAVAALASLVSLAPLGSQASHNCGATMVIFSRPLALNSGVLVCIAAGEEIDAVGYDPRIINPGSDAISVRYLVDMGASIPTIQGVLNGLGFVEEPITLTRVDGTGLGNFVYDSPVIDLPDGATSSGCVTASIVEEEEVIDTTSFHTVGTACA